MSILATLAKAKLDIETIKRSNLVAVKHTVDQLSRQWSYPWAISELQHSLLYKTWIEGLRRRKRRRRLHEPIESKGQGRPWNGPLLRYSESAGSNGAKKRVEVLRRAHLWGERLLCPAQNEAVFPVHFIRIALHLNVFLDNGVHATGCFGQRTGVM